jgi:hypothetical protein
LFGTLPAGQFRHRDHGFEWSRAEFEQWAERISTRFGYSVEFSQSAPNIRSMEHPRRWESLHVRDSCGFHVWSQRIGERHMRFNPFHQRDGIISH